MAAIGPVVGDGEEQGNPDGQVPEATRGPLKKVRTPGKRSVDEVADFLSEPPERFIKTLLYTTTAAGDTIAALVRGDHALSETKLRNALGVAWVAMADAETVQRHTGAEVGFAGPVGLRVRTLADKAVRRMTGGVTGANETDHHFADVSQERDFPDVEFADLRLARAGDRCPRCADGVFDGHRGIEVGNIFLLGTKYSVAMKATFLDANGHEHPMEMGCYGIGITRTAAAAVEQHHDEHGIIWPMPLAPAQVHVVPVNVADQRMRDTAEHLYNNLQAAGVEVLLDDREERPGIKFKDADLIGIPLRITIGAKSLERNCVEFKRRHEKTATDLPIADAVERLTTLVRAELKA